MKINDARYSAFCTWLYQAVKNVQYVTALPNDASFRRYFRVTNHQECYIAVDAPPNHETCQPFVAIAQGLRSLGLHTPQVISVDYKNGFMLLEDLGERLYLNEINVNSADTLYQDAICALHVMQTCRFISGYTIGHYDRHRYLAELLLFPEWYLKRYHQITTTVKEQHAMQSAFDLIIDCALNQPQRFVHMDYHSRNLLILGHHQVGILDFQDALWGPVTYDLVSLLRDCYLHWPSDMVKKWVYIFYEQSIARGALSSHITFDEFCLWFDWMGLQRHLKCIGLFARLFLRDNKPGYLTYLPNIKRYLNEVLLLYPELSALHRWLQVI